MLRYFLSLVLVLFFFQNANAGERSLSDVYLGSREGDPASLAENVSVVHGDYTEVEVDLTVSAPDSLILSRFYSSKDSSQIATWGGWRFNPHCFLSVCKEHAEAGGLEHTYVHVGNPDGTILTYSDRLIDASKRVLFKMDPEKASTGLVNTAKGEICCWTNLKNNELYFDPQTDRFELSLCSGGKRFYAKHPSLDVYLITHEILPSGNKVFYEFDEKGRLVLIKETNHSEKKVLGWIKIHYGNDVQVETSDGKTVDYHFEKEASGAQLLTEVRRSDKPPLHYQYQVVDHHALLLKKTLPEGRFIQVDYAADGRVRSITTPETTSVHFSYGDHCTEVEGPGISKSVYRFDDHCQLIAIEQYLDGSLYRVHKKSWGTKDNAGNLISTSVEDASGAIFYHKQFVYDKEGKGNIVEEREYGNISGIGSIPLIVDENGFVTNQDGQIKNYSYFSGPNTWGVFQTDAKGTGVKCWYKKGTHLLLKKLILTKGSLDSENESDRSGIKERCFYTYNEDAALTQVIVDDGKSAAPEADFGVNQRTITRIFPKQELPNVGAPEVIEQKYSTPDGKSEFLLKKVVNQFDSQGNSVSQEIYDANGHLCYTLAKRYAYGLLIFETDPLGNEAHYSYDKNHNLILETHSDTGISIEYDYDLKNRLICTRENNKTGKQFETHVAYDPAGNTLSEIDRLGNETLYTHDSLGRLIQVTYPAASTSYTYAYDLFDHPTAITDPQGRTLTRSYNIHGKPTEINHLDGTRELFGYDSGGNLRRYYGTNDLLQVFSYDYKRRLIKHEHFKREGKSSSRNKIYNYDAFHKIAEADENDESSIYTYDGAGRLVALRKGDQKVEFIYDSLGRTHGVKKWKSSKIFILEVREYDFLDRVIEQRTENHSGTVLVKKRYVYNSFGQIAQVIGYPQNKESILFQYEYDGLGRLCKETSALGPSTTITYDDAYLNEQGQKTRKQTLIDPMGNQTEEVFDAEDHLVRVSKKDKFGTLLAESESSYDSSGNKILEKVQVLSSNEPQKTYETAWSFNKKDQLESFTLGKGAPEERTVRFKYNAYGDIEARYPHGSKDPITYRYDEGGNLNKISCKEEFDYQFSYDRRKNLTEVSADSFTITYSFNAQDLPVSEEIEDDFGSYQVLRIYNGAGKVQILQLPDGSFIDYVYDGPFVKKAKRFDTNKKELYQYQVISRDQMGHILEEILPGQLGSRKQLWDEAGHRVEISTDFFQDRVSYDPLGNIGKRETILDKEKYVTEYDYNALEQLIVEKGEIEHHYSYDSIGNRLHKDDSPYKINGVNQLIKTPESVYTFDLNGNLSSKTVDGKTWTYRSNPLNHIVLIKDPDQNTVKFTYDPSGKRLTKQVRSKGERAKTFRFFYLGDTEIGCVDENGVITELKIPSDPNHPEATCIAIEVNQKPYVPLYDLQGNSVCLLDHQKCKIIETYRYSTYGEETITNEVGTTISDSSVGNPWRYRGKRIDKETGFLYFGYRYYDPEVGRWVTPDPAGALDGPNLYVYARNNPLTYVDYFGLSSAIDENCRCTRHDHPGWYNAPEGCVCICGKNDSTFVPRGHRGEIGSSIQSALYGIGHGVVDFSVKSLQDLQTAAVYLGSDELKMSLHERAQMIEAVEQSQANQMAEVEDWMLDRLAIDDSDAIYQSFRSATILGLEIGSLAAGGYEAVRGIMAFSKLAGMPVKIAGIGAKGMHGIENALGVGNFKYTNTAGSHITDLVKRGSFKGELSRPFMKSPYTVNEIMAAGKPVPDPGGVPGGLRWDVPGTFRGNEGTWELVLHPENEIIYHFNFK